MQRCYAVALAVLLLVLCAGSAVAANVPAQQDLRDQAFLGQLAQPAPTQVCQTNASVLVAPERATCVTAFCQKIGQCSTCPGGLSAWYCDLDVLRCVPY